MALCAYLVALFLGIAAFTAGAAYLGVVAGIIMAALALRYELLWLMKTLKPYRAPRVSQV